MVLGSALDKKALPPLKAIGQLGNLFILAQGDAGLYILDQHVVHERILYESIERKHEQESLQAQMLLTPVTIELSAAEETLIEAYLPLFEDFGIIIESFGARNYLIRSMPVETDKSPEEFIEDLLNALEEGLETKKPIQIKQELLISLSCKKAVKANWLLSIAEMQALLDKLRETRYPFICPHGRPVVYELPYTSLFKAFGRSAR